MNAHVPSMISTTYALQRSLILSDISLFDTKTVVMRMQCFLFCFMSVIFLKYQSICLIFLLINVVFDDCEPLKMH